MCLKSTFPKSFKARVAALVHPQSQLGKGVLKITQGDYIWILWVFFLPLLLARPFARAPSSVYILTLGCFYFQSGWPGTPLDSAHQEYSSQLYLKTSRECGCITATAHFWLTPINQADLSVNHAQAPSPFLCVVIDVS